MTFPQGKCHIIDLVLLLGKCDIHQTKRSNLKPDFAHFQTCIAFLFMIFFYSVFNFQQRDRWPWRHQTGPSARMMWAWFHSLTGAEPSRANAVSLKPEEEEEEEEAVSLGFTNKACVCLRSDREQSRIVWPLFWDGESINMLYTIHRDPCRVRS